MSIFDRIDELMDDIEREFFAPVRRKTIVIPIVVTSSFKKKDEKTEEKPKEEPKEEPKGETHEVPANVTVHTEPVYGVFHGAEPVDSIALDINGNQVFVEYDDAKKLYTQLGPALKRYKKEHQNE